MTIIWQAESWLDWLELKSMPVVIVGRPQQGTLRFTNLAEARKVFPELDPHRSTNNFTAAMRDELDGSMAMRFETWAAYNVFSS